MRLIVIIPTVDRRDVLARTVARLHHQSRRPDAVIISTTDREHVPARWLDEPEKSAGELGFPIVCLIGSRGLPAQRNLALDVVTGRRAPPHISPVLAGPLGNEDVVTFFDDDFLPADDYLEIVAEEFLANPDWVVASGAVPYDGANNAGYDFERGVELLACALAARSEAREVHDHVGAYGCNMSVRAGAIGARRFDERLPLYAWQEDIDFASRMRSVGRVVGLSRLVGIHLGTKSGRVNGKRIGYSQIANPLYLMRKGTMPSNFGRRLMARNVAANIAKFLWPESYVDRRGRLHGNLVALCHAVMGRIRPEYIMEMDV